MHGGCYGLWFIPIHYVLPMCCDHVTHILRPSNVLWSFYPYITSFQCVVIILPINCVLPMCCDNFYIVQQCHYIAWQYVTLEQNSNCNAEGAVSVLWNLYSQLVFAYWIHMTSRTSICTCFGLGLSPFRALKKISKVLLSIKLLNMLHLNCHLQDGSNFAKASRCWNECRD